MSLDAAVERGLGELLDQGLGTPHLLVLAGIGGGLLPERLGDACEVPLEGAEVWGPWHGGRVISGRLAGLDLWLVDDRGIDAPHDERAPWLRALPIWIAAAAGVRLTLHTSAGASLDPALELERGRLFLATDHLNLSGVSPLRGLGESRYGPLFPDQTRVHDPAVRQALLRAAGERGLSIDTGVVACGPGPSVETPAEQAWFAAAGAAVSVQGLAMPLIACAHAGLSAAALVAVVQRRGEPADLRRILERAEGLAPAIEDLLLTAAPALAELALETEEPLLPRAHENR